MSFSGKIKRICFGLGILGLFCLNTAECMASQEINTAENIASQEINTAITEAESGTVGVEDANEKQEGQRGTGEERMEAQTTGETEQKEEQMNQIEEDIMGDLELKEVDEAVEQLLQDDVSLEKLVKELMDGGQAWKGEAWKDTAIKALREAAGIQRETWIHILLLVLLSSVLANLSKVFDNQQISEISFYIIYLLLFVILLKSFDGFSSQISQVLEGITEFMRALLPSYYLALTASNGVSTAGIFYQMIIFIIYIAENLILKFLLPGVRIYLLMALINYLTGEQFLSKMTELLQSSIMWILKTIVGVILGIQLIQRMVSPAVDALRQTVIGKTAGILPGVGNIFSGITEMVLGSALLIKNCIGAAAVIIMLLAAVPPVIRLGISAVFYQLASACVQPVTDKRMVGCLHTMGESIGMLLKLLLAIEVLFLLTVAILAGSLG